MNLLDKPRATIGHTRFGKDRLRAGGERPRHGVSAAATTIHLSGEIDILTSQAVRERLLLILRYSTNLLIIDLSGVAFCDASGLAVLVGIQRRARAAGITLALAAPRPSTAKLLRITGLDRSLPMVA
jgi:anti-anti-sigma factor